ncbi:amidohydrolase [Streptomyces sp. NBC_01387]|uniref:amidohydrolase n=1 Tax=unclassified Streptomyces TaxID=2593676 RepID=UPI0022599A99|nr:MULTISPECIES: amidohydrolase [unclassified Streptomyces]MCX4552703.1 amidohydrolase [Streptomyces sp. NBC_01500]WSC24043.1 amidohydrolase [Streptomyces sp. NBC_01766]
MTPRTPSAPAATLVLRGARIHTVDPGLPRAEALAVRDGRIAWIGDDEGAAAWIGPDTQVIEGEGRLVLPGFIDAHNHVRLGSDDACVQLAGAQSLEEIHARILRWRAANPDATWIEAEAFDYSAVPDGRMPTARDLDPATGDTPAFVLSYDVHTVWLNTAALRLLGVTAAQPDLPFGTARTDPATGEPTGFFTDFAVKGLSRDGYRALHALGVPWASPDRQYQRLAASLDDAISFGITTVVEPQNSLDDLPLFERARAEGRLRSRIVAALFHPRGTTGADLDDFAAAAREHADDRLRLGPLKLYIDDVVEPRTAAMLQPYAGCAHHRGDTFYPPEEFADLLTALDARGFQCFVHATGDRGIRTVLDAIEQARAVNGPRDARHQVVHVECLDPEDLPRFAALDVVACMQPRHCAPEIAGPGQDWAENVGEERWHKAWPMRSLHEAGTVLAFSSDWNVAEMDPMVGIYTAVTRRPLSGGPAWIPEETVDVRTAVHGYTMGSAYANFLEHERGSLTVGKLADFAVFSRDILGLPIERTPGTIAQIVVVGGEVVHTAG